METKESTVPSWRERKRQQTLQRLTETALALFSQDGYEATTLDAIAEASGISKRTFFHYFKSKEEILAAWQAGVPDLVRIAIVEEPSDQTPVEVVRNALAKMPSNLDVQQAIVIDRIIRSNAQLRAGNLAKYLQLERVVFEALCERWPEVERRNALRMLAMASVGALRLAIDSFAEEGGRIPLASLVQQAFAALVEELTDARS